MGTAKITGGVKFFDKNVNLFRDGGSATASSNDDAVNFLLDVSRYTQWESVGSNDLTSEVITVNFSRSFDIDTVFLANMNLKEFSIKYLSGGSYIDFTNVYGVNNVQSASINETAYTYSTAFYQFDKVNTNSIQITATKTQVANEEKFIGQVISCEEIGTLLGFPRVTSASNRNETKATALSRRAVIQKTYETNMVKINFKTHPYQNDTTLIDNLFDREEPFLIYPCGGRTGTQYFKVEQKNWRLDDIYNVQMMGKLKNDFEKGVYSLGFNKSVTFEEHI